MSPPQFWNGLLFTVRALHLSVRSSDPVHGTLTVGPVSGPTGFALFSTSINRRRAFLRIRTYSVSQRSLTPGIPLRPLGVSMTVNAVLQRQEMSPTGALWSDLSLSPFHIERLRQAHKLEQWMSQEILIGETQYWMNHRMAFSPPPKKGAGS